MNELNFHNYFGILYQKNAFTGFKVNEKTCCVDRRTQPDFLPTENSENFDLFGTQEPWISQSVGIENSKLKIWTFSWLCAQLFIKNHMKTAKNLRLKKFIHHFKTEKLLTLIYFVLITEFLNIHRIKFFEFAGIRAFLGFSGPILTNSINIRNRAKKKLSIGLG